MEFKSPIRPSLSIAARAADGGVVMSGLIMIVTLALGFATYYPVAAFVAWGAIFATPFVLYFLLRRSYAVSGFTEGFIELWAEGIALFFLGSLVPALVVYLLLKYVQPDYMANWVDFSIAAFSQQGTPEAESLVKVLTTLRDNGGLPTAAQIAAQVIALNMFIGMILSLIEANFVIIRFSNPERRRRLAERLK